MNKSKWVLGISSAVAFNVAIAAGESPLSYTSLSVDYAKADVLDEDASGYGISGSVALTDSLFAVASYASYEADDYDISTDGTVVGLGLHTPITATTDFVFGAGYVKASADARLYGYSASADGNGYTIQAGFRSMLSPNFEFSGQVAYEDIEDEGDTSTSIGVDYYLTPTVSLGLGYTNADDVSIVNVGVSFYLR